MFSLIDRFFQSVLMSARWLILIVVLSGILSTGIMILIGTYEIFAGLGEAMRMIFVGVDDIDISLNTIVSDVIRSVDAFLIATVLLLFSIGLYELFINKMTAFDKIEVRGNVLCITSLDELKEKLGSLIVMVLIVTFFERAINVRFSATVDLLFVAVSILMISIAIFLTHGKARRSLLKK